MTQPRHVGIEFNYDPAVCDLCGSVEYKTILDMPHKSITSDTRILESGLRKIQCMNCKLVRNGYPFSYEKLRTHYRDEYNLGDQSAIAEPLFFTADGTFPRSEIIFNWIMDNLEGIGFGNPRSILEVGCSEGSLLSQFASRLSGCEASGMEVSKRSVARARERGLRVEHGSYRDVAGSYDLIYSFAVIEHVPSPSDFLAHLKSRLGHAGLLISAQPCQDDGSNDIFFADHLHHFFSDHVAELGRRTGLKEIKRSKDNPYIPDFSLHIFQSGEVALAEPEQIEGDSIAFDRTIARWEAIFHNLDAWLDRNVDRKLAVWGVGQMFKILCAYTKLGGHQIVAAFDDNPDRFAQSGFEFPVGRFEEAKGLDDPALSILLTFVPGTKVLDRLKAGSVQYFCPLI